MANQPADENYVVRLVVETDEALARTKKWRDEVDKVKRDLLDLRNKSGMALDDVKKGYLEAAQSSTVFTEDLSHLKSVANQATKEINQVDRAMDKASKEMQEGGSSAKSFGSIIETAIGFTVGTIAVGALQVASRAVRKFVEEIKIGIREAGEFSMDVARLNVNLRAFQRTGGDLDESELIPFMESIRNQFKIFSEQEMVAATQEVLNWSRQLDLTGEQTKQFLDLAAQQAVIMGQDLPTAVRQLATAITTGRTQSLRPLGIAMDATFVKTQALKRGLIEEGEAVDNHTKAMIILEQAQKTANERMGETTEIIETLGGEQEQVSTNWKNLRKDIAEGFAPALKTLRQWLNRIITGFNDVVDVVKGVDVFMTAFFKSTLRGGEVAFKNLWNAMRGGDERIEFDFYEEFDKAFQKAEKRLFPLQTIESVDTKELVPDIDEIEEEGDKLEDAFKDLYIDIRETIIDGQQRIEEENEKFREKIRELTLKYMHKEEKDYIKFENDIAKINRQYLDKLSEENEEFRKKELNKEDDFQNKLRELRENFLLDLEDALRERDAKQVLSLIRRFNLREKQLKRQHDLEKKQRKQRFQDQVEDLKRQRDIRIREAQFAYQERRQLALKDHAFNMRLQMIRHKQRIADLREETQQRIEELTRRFEDEHRITREGAERVKQALEEYFGKGGKVDAIYNHLLLKTNDTATKVAYSLDQLAQHFQKLAPMLGFPESEMSPLAGPGPENPTWSAPGGFAEGGSVIATEPTTATFGEGGEPEMATFTPLGRIGQDVNKVFLSGDEKSQGGKVQVELLLSEDLVARTQESVYSGMAEVIVRRNK